MNIPLDTSMRCVWHGNTLFSLLKIKIPAKIVLCLFVLKALQSVDCGKDAIVLKPNSLVYLDLSLNFSNGQTQTFQSQCFHFSMKYFLHTF